jgi:F-type H+-transporting ATPase subunit a
MGGHHDIIYFPLHIGGIDLSITNKVVMLWLAAALTAAFLIGAARALKPTGEGRLSNMAEALMDFVRENISEAFMGHNAAKWFPLVATIFFFILFVNLLGLVPIVGHFTAATSDLNVTAVLAVTVFVIVQVVAVIHHGPKYYFNLLFPKSAPAWLRFSLMPLIELIGTLARPFSLAIRLFANMTAGHQIIVVLITGELVGITYMLQQGIMWKFIAVAPLAGVVIMDAFEIFVAFIQAFIFALLSALYLGEAMEESH